VQLGKSVRENYVRYKGEPSEEDLSTLSEFILKKYGDMLFRRIEKVSISPQ